MALLAAVTAVVASALVSTDAALAAPATTFTGPTCANGTASILASWDGATVGGVPVPPGPGLSMPRATSIISLNTAQSGYPAGSITLTHSNATGPAYFNLWTPAGAAPQYNVRSLQMGTNVPNTATSRTLDLVFPTPTTVYFPIFDVDSGEAISVEGFNGSTPVAGNNHVRAASANMTVTTAGTTTTFATNTLDTPDNDERGLVEIQYDTPVTRIHLEDSVPFGSNEIGNLYSCQAQDVVKSATTPALTSMTASGATYHSDLTFTLRNTEPAGTMRIYGPQVTDSLATALGGSPAYTSVRVTSISATGPTPACQANTGYTGVGNDTLLQGTASAYLDPGQTCTIKVGVDATYPLSVTPFTKNNTATASGTGTNPTISDPSTNGTTPPSQPKVDTPSPTPLEFPAVPALQLTKALNAPREAATDQFTVAIRTGGASGTVVNSTANSTTTGSGTTVTAGTGTTGVIPAVIGTPYTLTEAAAGTTSLSNYTARITCTDSAGVQQGLPTNAVFNAASPPSITPVLGANISCVLTNTAQPIMTWGKVVDRGAGTQVNPGDTVKYTLTIANTGSVPNPSFSAYDDLSAVVNNATFNTGSITVTPGGSGSATYDAGTKRLTWSGAVPAASTITISYTVTVTANAYGQLKNAFIDKTVTNPIGASLTWRKTDTSAAKNLLAGASWTLTPVPSGTAITVTDCIAASAASCTGADTDPVGGQFFVKGLTPGAYRLVETKAPVGFVLDPTPIAVTVSATTQTTVLADVTNAQQPVPLIPFTGGLGTDHLLIAGGGLLALTVGLFTWQLVRRRRIA